MGRDSSFILKTNHLSHIYICKIVFSRFVAFLFFFFKLLFHEWNICISWLSGFRFLSIISFFQKVTSAGNVSGCKLTGSVKIILLLVMLDSSSLSMWCYCCIIHIFGMRIPNIWWPSNTYALSPNVLSGLALPSVAKSLVLGRQTLGCSCLPRKGSLELARGL